MNIIILTLRSLIIPIILFSAASLGLCEAEQLVSVNAGSVFPGHTFGRHRKVRIELMDHFQIPAIEWPRTLLSYPVYYAVPVPPEQLVSRNLREAAEIPFQLSEIESRGERLQFAAVNFFSDLPSDGSSQFELSTAKPVLPSAPLVQQRVEGNTVVLDAGKIKVRLPATGAVVPGRKVSGPMLQPFRGECPAAADMELKSPDGKVGLHFDLKTSAPAANQLFYNVRFQDRIVLADSRLGLQLRDGVFAGDFQIVGTNFSTSDTTWKPVLAERETIRDHFNQLVVELQTTASPHRRLQITFRAYDEGVAFCYTLPVQRELGDFVIQREATQFAFTGDHTAWAVYSAQGNYDPDDPRRRPKSAKTGSVKLSELKPGVERPLTVRVADDLYAAITEARLVDYARMKLRPATNAACTLETFLDAERGVNGEVTGKTPFTSPWRVVMVANAPGKLLEQNDLVLNLNDPCALTDTSWIKPGKVIREATLTTAGGKACVDFAVERGLQFIEYDAGWYGYESDVNSDARAVHLDPRRNPDPTSLNLPDVIDYANARKIGVILYVNQKALTRLLDEILPLYEKWGVKGVKYGFVNVGSQSATAWLHAAVRKAAAHHLMVDIHDEFRNTGYQRTYPNLVTCEGIGGNEEFPTPVHNATVPFTRFLTGPADYTFCWYDSRLKNTHAHQLALSTIFFSPWQFIYWYDKPSAYDGDPALDYWQHLPTTWDETRVIQGDIGRRAVVARRKGDEWFVGAISPGAPEVAIPLTFLAPGKQYRAHIYSDPPPGSPATGKVRVEERAVNATTTLAAEIPPNGGLAVRLVPVEL